MRLRVASYAWLVIWLVVAAGCNHAAVDPQADPSPWPVAPPPAAVNVVADIAEAKTPAWKVSAAPGTDRNDLRSVVFLDDARGWAGGDGAVYETDDGGRHWERLNVEMSPTTSAVGMAFSTSYMWGALQRRPVDPSRYQDHQIVLVRAGGDNQGWQSQRVFERAFVMRVSFVKEEGWLTGLEYTGPGRFDTSLLVLHTSDEGEHWVDVSDDLNRVAAEGKGSATGWVADIVTGGPLVATVLTSRGHLFSTGDGGKSWRRIRRDENDPLIVGMTAFRLGFKPDRLHWVAGGEHGEEGTGSTLAFEQPQGSWKRYYLGGIELKDVQFLSGTDILVCGLTFPKDAQPDFEKTEGIILYSSDGGDNWSVVYRNAQVKSINALGPVNSGHVWAVGNQGIILHLEKVLKSQ